MPTEPRATLLYLSYNSAKDMPYLPALIGTAGEPLPVMALDNASSDDSLAQLEALGLDAEASPVNLGFTAGINVMLQSCQTEWAIIANPDVRPMEQGWLPKLLDVPEECGVVGARLVSPPQVMGGGYIMDRHLPFVRRVPVAVDGGEVLAPALLGWTRVSQHRGGMTSYREPREVAWVAFALCALRMDCVSRLGLLDETYWHYVSDQEYGLRAWANGWSVRYQPVSFHHPGCTAIKTAPAEVESLVCEDVRKWCRVEHHYLVASDWA